jgi:rubredoxin
MTKKIDPSIPKDEIEEKDNQEGVYCVIIPPQSLKPSMICPRCKAAKIEYDGMLNLVCPNCGLTEAGACT